MFKRLFLAAIIALTATMAQMAASQEPSSSTEDVKARLSKQEIIDLVMATGRMPAQQQKARIDSILQNASASTTPRSDFLFCTGMAYLGNYKGQDCLGGAYENGRGIVEDISEAYLWYATALENNIADKAEQQKLEVERDRVKTRLQSSYPAPSDDDLDEMVRQQKTRIAQYQEDAKRTKK